MAERAPTWHRLHPLSPLIRSGRGVIAVLTIAGLSSTSMAGLGGGLHWYDIMIASAAAAAAIVNWFVTRWRLDGATLRIETGLFRRDSRQLPVARIQAVDVVRPLAARVLGLAELRVRLAGSSAADGRLSYLTESAAADLRARLLAGHHGLDLATPEPGEYVVAAVPPGRLIGSALLPAIPLALVATALGILLENAPRSDSVQVAAQQAGPLSPATLVAAAGPLAWWLVVSATLAWRRVTSQYGFTVAASPDGIRIRRGLLGTVAETIPAQRVQAVRMIEPLLWRPLSWCRLEVDVAGHPGREEREGSGAARKALLPVGRLDQAAPLLRLAIGDGLPEPAKPPRRARWKAPFSYHFLAAGYTSTMTVAVTGRLRRETTWVPLAKAQSVRFVQGPIQRCLDLATVHVDAAGHEAKAAFAQRSAGEASWLVTELAAHSRTARRSKH